MVRFSEGNDRAEVDALLERCQQELQTTFRGLFQNKNLNKNVLLKELNEVDAALTESKFGSIIGKTVLDASRSFDPVREDHRIAEMQRLSEEKLALERQERARQRQLAECQAQAARQAQQEEAARQAQQEAARQAQQEAARQARQEEAARQARQAEIERQARLALLHIVIEEPSPERAYDKALVKLKDYLNENTSYVNSFIEDIIAQVELLKNNDKTPVEDLTEALSATYERLMGQIDSDEYEESASKMEGKPSVGMKILGGFMLALGVALIVLGIIYAPLVMSAVAFAGLTGTAATVAAVTTVSVPTIAAGAAGYGFFACGSQHGLSRVMHNANEQLNKMAESRMDCCG